jgi:hypothetical protein
MEVYLHNGERRQVHFRKDSSAILSYPAFPGGTVRWFQNDKVRLLMKEIISDLFSIRYKIFQFSERQKMESVSGALGIHSRIMLQNDLDLSINSSEALRQKEGTNSLFSGRINKCIAILEAGVEYRGTRHLRRKRTRWPVSSFFPRSSIQRRRGKERITLSLFYITCSASNH